MNKKSLILTISLVLIVFLSASIVCAETIADYDSANSDVLEVENTPALTAQQVTVNTTDTNDQIQAKINSLNDGDTLNFEKGDYKNVSLYVNKSITINGNGATLYGYNKLSPDKINPIIQDKTSQGGYAITNLATLYILETKGLVLKDINIIAGDHSGTTKGKTPTGEDDPNYSNCVIYAYKSNNTQIINTTINGCSWGIWVEECADTIIENNKVMNQGITGIFSFKSPRSVIRFNKVTNAKNHGIDVRHGLGPAAKVLNNTVIGSKEGIYLLHSAKHTVTGNTITDCSISSITCCGASHIIIKDNKLENSRIGILLGGGAPAGGNYTGYNNITIGANEWKIDELPFPPSFQYYVAEAKADYASMSSMMGTHTDSSLSNVTYVEYTEIKVPGPIVIDYETILKPTGKNITITAGMSNNEIQAAINSLNNGDTIIFQKNEVFENISIYIDKNIKVIGNNATLKSYESPSIDLIPEKIINGTKNGGYGVIYSAVLYCVNNTNAVISDLNIICRYPGYNPTEKINNASREYCTAGIYSILSKDLTITNCNIQGASWGMFIGERQQGRPHAVITNNKVSNQFTTGILCFGSANSIIANNTVTNAYNHGIDVRFKQGKNVTVFNNTVSGSKEGIYLLHSEGHKVYGNTILNSKISSITCYGSGNEYIFNNVLKGSRIAIILGGGYYNVTIGENTFTPDKLPFPPTFEHYLVKSENKYYDKVGIKVQGTYSDSKAVNLTANDVTVGYKKGTFEITLKDSKGKAIANKAGTITIGNKVYNITTDANGSASIDLELTTGTYEATVHTVSDYYNKAGNAVAEITVNDDKTATEFTASSKTVYIKTIASGYKYSVILKDANGNRLANKSVVITYNNRNYNAITHANGVATVTLKATAIGSKQATIKFVGDDSYKEKTFKVTIKVTKEATKLSAAKKIYKSNLKIKKYTVTLKSKSNKAIYKATVVLKIKGKTYRAIVNSRGQATFKITKFTTKGNHIATISFAGNSYYLGKTVKQRIIIR